MSPPTHPRPDSEQFADVLRTPGGGAYVRLQHTQESRGMTSLLPTGSPESSAKRMEIIQWLQLIGILIAVAGIFMAIGKRDQTLEDLKIIVNRLVDSDIHMRERMSTIEGQIKYNDDARNRTEKKP